MANGRGNKFSMKGSSHLTVVEKWQHSTCLSQWKIDTSWRTWSNEKAKPSHHSQVCMIYSTSLFQDRKPISRVENKTQASDCSHFINYSANKRMHTGHSDCLCDEQDNNVSSKRFSLYHEEKIGNTVGRTTPTVDQSRTKRDSRAKTDSESLIFSNRPQHQPLSVRED